MFINSTKPNKASAYFSFPKEFDCFQSQEVLTLVLQQSGRSLSQMATSSQKASSSLAQIISTLATMFMAWQQPIWGLRAAYAHRIRLNASMPIWLPAQKVFKVFKINSSRRTHFFGALLLKQGFGAASKEGGPETLLWIRSVFDRVLMRIFEKCTIGHRTTYGGKKVSSLNYTNQKGLIYLLLKHYTKRH